jgi:hypothetical protein
MSWVVSCLFLDRGRRVAWILRLVKTGAEGEDHGTDLMEISRPDVLASLASSLQKPDKGGKSKTSTCPPAERPRQSIDDRLAVPLAVSSGCADQASIGLQPLRIRRGQPRSGIDRFRPRRGGADCLRWLSCHCHPRQPGCPECGAGLTICQPMQRNSQYRRYDGNPFAGSRPAADHVRRLDPRS